MPYKNLMKEALSRILEFFAGYERREKTNGTRRSYCVCGALKSKDQDREGEK
jgi:hypothetical protein